MENEFKKLLQLAESNVKNNPTINKVDVKETSLRYLRDLANEVDEVTSELKPNNVVHLQDELSDIAWSYVVILKICERNGWIDSVDEVFSHALQKYQERSPAFLETEKIIWENIKIKQKKVLKQKHKERYEK